MQLCIMHPQQIMKLYSRLHMPCHQSACKVRFSRIAQPLITGKVITCSWLQTPVMTDFCWESDLLSSILIWTINNEPLLVPCINKQIKKKKHLTIQDDEEVVENKHIVLSPLIWVMGHTLGSSQSQCTWDHTQWIFCLGDGHAQGQLHSRPFVYTSPTEISASLSQKCEAEL